MASYFNYLLETDLFYNLTKTQLELIESICELSEYRDKEYVFKENDKSSDLFLVLRGEINIEINPSLVSSNPIAESKPQVIATLRQGQSFGEIALVDNGLRSASARSASKNTKLLKISQKKMIQLCEIYPEMGYKIMYNLATDLAQKIRSTDMRLRENALKS